MGAGHLTAELMQVLFFGARRIRQALGGGESRPPRLSRDGADRRDTRACRTTRRRLARSAGRPRLAENARLEGDAGPVPTR